MLIISCFKSIPLEDYMLFIATLFFLTLIIFLIIWRRNILTLLEVLAILLFVSTINQNLIDIFTANLKVINITKQIQMFWTFFLSRHLFIPALVTLFIDLYSSSKFKITKFLLFVLCILLLTAVEQSIAWFKIITLVKWQLWWSLLEWCLIILFALGSRKFLHYLLLKGTSKNDI
jgi:hypothetical protein